MCPNNFTTTAYKWFTRGSLSSPCNGSRKRFKGPTTQRTLVGAVALYKTIHSDVFHAYNPK